VTVTAKPRLFNGPLGRRPNGSNLQMRKRRRSEALLCHAPEEGVHTIDAGEDEPVVSFKLAKRCIERPVRTRRTDLDKGNLDDLAAQIAQRRGQSAGLLLRA
jgi:hypothetical protein